MYIITNVSSENTIFNQTKYNVDNYLPSHNLSAGRYMNIAEEKPYWSLQWFLEWYLSPLWVEKDDAW